MVEHTPGTKPISVLDYTNTDFSSAIDLITNRYESQPAIYEIKNCLESPPVPNIYKVNAQDVEKLIKKLRPTRSIFLFSIQPI